MNQHPAVCEAHFDFRFTEKSPIGTISLATLFRYLIEVTDDHALHLRINFNTMFAQNLTWAILRVAMEIPKSLSSLSALTVSTWPSSRENLYFYRDFAILDRQKKALAQATSQWVILDKFTHKPVKTPQFMIDLYNTLYQDSAPKRFTVPFTRWNTLDKNLYPHRYEHLLHVRRSDTDINGHTNAACYVEFIEESIPTSVYHSRQPRFLEIHCLAESFEKDEILAISEFCSDHTEGLHTLLRKKDNTIIAKAKTLWQ